MSYLLQGRVTWEYLLTGLVTVTVVGPLVISALLVLVRRLQAIEDELRRLTRVDGLTGAGNRRSFDQSLAKEWRRARRDGRPLALVLVDIDRFKAFNDGYGHLAGDDALRRVADALTGTLRRPADLLARYGGEEFAALLPGNDLAGAEQAAEGMREAVEALSIEHQGSDAADVLTVSLGVAARIPEQDAGPDALVAAADAALYEAKAEGRNRVVRTK